MRVPVASIAVATSALAALAPAALGAPAPRLAPQDVASVRAWAGIVNTYVAQMNAGPTDSVIYQVDEQVRACPTPTGAGGQPVSARALVNLRADLTIMQSIVIGISQNRAFAATAASGIRALSFQAPQLRRWSAAQATYINQTVILANATTLTPNVCGALALAARTSIGNARVLPLMGVQPTVPAAAAFARITGVGLGQSSPGPAFVQGRAFLAARGMPGAARTINQVPERA